MHLIGIAGKAGAGKDTVADKLCAKYKFVKYSFADPIKQACEIIFKWDKKHLNTDLKEQVDPQFGISPRQAMQTLGTDWGRNMISQEIWIDAAQAKYLDMLKDSPHTEEVGLVIPDVRFNNEAEMIRRLGGTVIHVHRDDIPSVRAHASENGVNIWSEDWIIENNETLEQLYKNVDQLMSFRHQLDAANEQ